MHLERATFERRLELLVAVVAVERGGVDGLRVVLALEYAAVRNSPARQYFAPIPAWRMIFGKAAVAAFLRGKGGLIHLQFSRG